MSYEDKLKPVKPGTYQSKMKPVALPKKVAKESDKGFLGNVAVDILRTPARLATNVVQAGQIALGKERTNPFSGTFFGEVEPVGMKNGGGLSVENLKDAVGAGVDLASNIPMARGAGITFDVLKGATKQGGKEILKRAAMPLIKEGAAAGAMAGGGRALQDNKSLGGVALDSAIGGAAGGVLAPLFGATAALAGKGASKYLNVERLFKGEESKFAKEAAKKDVDKVARYVQGPIGAKEKRGLLREKRGTEYSGIFGLGNKQFKLGDEDYLMAQAVKDLVDPRMSQADANIDRILKNVYQVRENELLPFLRENPVPYNWIDLKKYLDNKMKPSTLLKINTDNSNVFNAIKNKGIEILNTFPKTQEGVQQARTAIDNMINDEFGPAIWDKNNPLNTGAKEAVLKLRKALNDFTHDSLRTRNIPNVNKVESFITAMKERGMNIESVPQLREQLLQYFGTEVLPENELAAIIFRNKLRNMNLQLEAADNIWLNSAKEVGKSRLKNISSDPVVRTGLGLGAGYGLSQIFGGRGVGSASGNNSN